MADELNTPAEEPSELSFDDLDRLLNYDPFSQEAAAAETPADEAGTPSAPAQEGGEAPSSPEAQPGQVQAQTPDAPAPAEDPEKALLKQQLEAMQREIEAIRRPAQPPAQPAGGPQAEVPVPDYSFNIPDTLLQHLQSDNPTEVRTGVAALAQGVAQTVHRQVMQHAAEMFGAVVQQHIPQMIQQHVTGVETAKEIFSDFYGTYKELNVPTLRPLIAATAQQVATEFRANSWTPQLRDETARRVRAALAAGNPVQPTSPAAPPARPPVQFGGNGARPAGNVPASKTAEDIQKTLFGG